MDNRTPFPEVLAPAGDLDSLKAALAAGADAVYLGLEDGFNARARAQNFSLELLPDLVRRVHRAGAKLYVTVNTLLFESEIPAIEEALRGIASAGVDAILVQDPGVALLAGAICPELHIHASTQMTISSPEGARFAETLGITRIVMPRELSVGEIKLFADATDLELEAFIHGALCVSWSGQCLSSEAWGGRSANRGLCAQGCRMPYELVVDGERRRLDDQSYMLSPRDQSGLRAIPALLEAGVCSFKIEGRMKGPSYIVTAVGGVRHWLESVIRGATRQDEEEMAENLADMQLTFSRGFGDGFLAGSDHQNLVDGRFPKHRGLFLGMVEERKGCRIRVRRQVDHRFAAVGEKSAPLPDFGGSADGPKIADRTPRAGMGVVFDRGRPEDRDEPGGPIFDVEEISNGWWLGFGKPGPNLDRVAAGQRVWITSDPVLQRAAETMVNGPEPEGRLALGMSVSGQSAGLLQVEGRIAGHQATVRSETVLEPACGRGLNADLLSQKLGALGGTPFRLDHLDVGELESNLHLPVSELKSLRRRLVALLLDELCRQGSRKVATTDQATALRERLSLAIGPTRTRSGSAELLPLCRTDEQLDAVIAAGFNQVELDWMEMVGLSRAIARARAAGLRVGIATVRVQKPGERGYDARIEKLKPDHVLVRHWGGLMEVASAPERPILIGDFSLNVTNSLTAFKLLGLGLDYITMAHDLDATQLLSLVDVVPADRVVVTLHHHIPTFHTEHCVYAHQLSSGRDIRSCGRPCDTNRISLRDHLGLEHPVIVDVGCRNTIFNAQAQSAAHLVGDLLTRGVRRFRIEFVRETGAEVSEIVEAYRQLLAGKLDYRDLIRQVGVHEQFGVTAGTMRVLGQAEE